MGLLVEIATTLIARIAVEASVTVTSYIMSQLVQGNPLLTFNLLSLLLTFGVFMTLHIVLDRTRDESYRKFLRHPSL